MRTPARARALALAGLLTGTLTLTACGSGDDPTVGSSGAGDGTSAEVAQADVNDQDRAFVAGMVPHHEQAVEMAEIILAKNPSEPVRVLAEKIKAAQEPEIGELKGMLEAFGEQPSGDGHGGHGGGSSDGAMHGGMMTEDDMAELEAATGTDAERMFLTMMIEHHKGAVEAAKAETADGEYPPARELAERIAVSQAAEIGEMERLLTQL